MLLALAIGACSGDRVDPSRAALDVDSVKRALADTKPTHIDSVFPSEEEIRRFQAAVRDSTDTLRGAAPSREALVRRFVAAIERNDTVGLRALAIGVSEFGWLYYPTSRFSRDPYFQKPDILWFQIAANGEHDGNTLLRRFGGRRFHVTATICPDTARREGVNRLWEGCRLRLRGDTASVQFFGTVLERDRRFKLVSLANKL